MGEKLEVLLKNAASMVKGIEWWEKIEAELSYEKYLKVVVFIAIIFLTF